MFITDWQLDHPHPVLRDRDVLYRVGVKVPELRNDLVIGMQVVPRPVNFGTVYAESFSDFLTVSRNVLFKYPIVPVIVSHNEYDTETTAIRVDRTKVEVKDRFKQNWIGILTK